MGETALGQMLWLLWYQFRDAIAEGKTSVQPDALEALEFVFVTLYGFERTGTVPTLHRFDQLVREWEQELMRSRADGDVSAYSMQGRLDRALRKPVDPTND